MLAKIFPRNSSHPRQHSTFTGSSITSGGSLSAKSRPITKTRGRKRSPKNKENGNNSEDSHSHHSESSADDDSNSSLVSVKAGLSKCCVQGTLASRRWQMFQMIALPFIPIIALIVQNSSLLSTVIANMREAGEIKQQIGMIVQIGKLLAELQQERADFGYCLFTNETSLQPPTPSSLPSTGSSIPIHADPITDELAVLLTTIASSSATMAELIQSGRVSMCRETLQTRFQRTDWTISNLSDYVADYVPSINAITDKRERVFMYTSESTGATDDTTLDELIWYNVANDVILELLTQRIRTTKSTGAWKPLIAYMNMIRAIENYSISMVYGLYYFGKGRLSQNSFNKYIQYDSLAADYLNQTKSFSPEITALWETYIGQTWKNGFDTLVERLILRRAIIYRNVEGEAAANSSTAKIYYANMTTYISELRGFQFRLRELVDDQVTEELKMAQTKQFIAALLLAIVLGISPVIIILVRKVTVTIQTFSLELGSKTSELKREKRRSDKLLKQMLPAEVIRQLKKNRQVPAENFECVTIYFSDIVSFTKLSSTSSPMEIIVMLNSLYKLFDSKIELYDVYKVETIGDAYMVVSGLPLRNANRHAGEICTMALDLIAGVKQFQIPHRPGTPLQIRVGINSGPCVAGVVGTKMPRYCLFGDAINVASRMESHGEAMKIHVTQYTKQILDELGGYILDSRGILEIKGKGTMTTYWLLDKEGGLPKKEVELQIPGFFKPQKDNTPEFIHEIFGSSGSEDGEDMIKLQVSNLRHPLPLPPPPHATAITVTSHTNSKIPLGMLKHA